MDEYAYLESPIHRWDTRCKMIGLTTLIFAFATVNSFPLILPMLAISAIIYFVSKLPLLFLFHRLRYPSLFVLGLVVVLPFISGTTIIGQIGYLTVRQEGCFAMLLITSRFVAIMTLCLVMFSTSSVLTTIKALRDCGISPILADLIFLSYRYLFEIGHQFKTMEMALRLRGFQPRHINQRNLSVLASLAGTLLVRSYEQSEQVYQAMRLRGYGGNTGRGDSRISPTYPGILGSTKSFTRDWFSLVLMILCLIISVIFIGVAVS
ncbi:MAG TPA: cobalt ECF transporter T component CbiQ [Oscillatoriaceae cyanobacterium M33_DOE_052]|uniref:Cobalt ECF transporter T component CbiQ n=1 Tax=Planktothricoides sp. SpSt-374 TaxID=2282167 RepID=A0A7C3ZY96_9CYAN|nr:cobalt ECF transporter T component CbiQ [Oscillatoriaceae cyanobacterium M33_DOE_052]